MGQRSSSESIGRVFQAFASQHTWKQKELADHIGIKVPALHRILSELQNTGIPLQREEEHPHVYWSVPKGWFPGGMVFSKDSTADLLQAIFNLPQVAARERLLQRVRNLFPHQPALSEVARSIITHQPSENEERFIPLLQTALTEKKVLRIRYFTASRGDQSSRAISLQCVVNEPRLRLVAYCHRSKALRWFRVDGIHKAIAEPEISFQDVAKAEIQRFLEESVDGFHSGSGDEELAFFVSYPDARWVRNNLLPMMRVDEDGSSKDKLRIVCGTAGAIVVARFIAGLGDIAVAEGTPLKLLVTEIAAGALRNSQSSRENPSASQSKTERRSSQLHSKGRME